MCDRVALSLPGTVLTACPRSRVWTLAGRSEQVSNVRALAAGFLDGFPAADEAVLLISELAANAVNHSASGLPGGTFTVRAWLDGAGVRAELHDQGSAWDGDLRRAEAPHGLFLLRALATTCGTYLRAPGRVTWFTLAAPPCRPPPARPEPAG